MIQVGIFDVGGVLIETTLNAMHQDIQDTLGISREDFVANYKPLINLHNVGKISEDEFWKLFMKKTRATGSLPKQSLFKRSYYQGNLIKNDALLAKIKTLHERGLTTAILSNNITSHVELMREFGVADDFDYTFLSNEIGFAKPDKQIYLYALEKMGIKPEQAFFVDDLEENIKTARDLGINGIVFKNTKDCLREIRKLGIKI